MKHIYKICTACLGEGKVEDINPEKMKVTITPSRLNEDPTEKRDISTCYVCKGDGFIPTGFFMFDEDDLGKKFLEILADQPGDMVRTIINRT